MAIFVIQLDETEFFSFSWAGFTIILKVFRGMLVIIKAGSCKINRK